MDSPGERFAQAVAHQDMDALCAVLADTVDFQALTPRRHWQASTGGQAAEEIILGTWFDAGTQILELCSVTTGEVAESGRENAQEGDAAKPLHRGGMQ